MTPPKPHPQPSTKSLCLFSLIPFFSLISPSAANTEKVIFTAPPPLSHSELSSIPFIPNFDAPVLGPATRWSIRKNLTRIFPLNKDEDEDERGYPTWLLLDKLTPGQRYELRVCWSALQPTAFTLDAYPLTTVVSTPSLLKSLTNPPGSPPSNLSPQQQEYIENLRSKLSFDHLPPERHSVLLIRVLAAADYVSHHASLMTDPPPVLVDLILDPYLYNVLPQSLVPTACYLVAVGIVTWFVARWVARSLSTFASTSNDDQTKKDN